MRWAFRKAVWATLPEENESVDAAVAGAPMVVSFPNAYLQTARGDTTRYVALDYSSSSSSSSSSSDIAPLEGAYGSRGGPGASGVYGILGGHLITASRIVLVLHVDYFS